MSDTPDLGPVPERVPVDTQQVRELVEEQFPQWAGLPVEPVAKGGWDNWTFHLGPDLVVRLPSAAEYAEAVEKEHRWLPALAPRLPLPDPGPAGEGQAEPGLPAPVVDLRMAGRSDGRPGPGRGPGALRRRPGRLPGRPAGLSTPPTVPDRACTTGSGAARCAPTTRSPSARSRSWRDSWTSHWLERSGRTRSHARWDGVDRWFHGDVAAGNLLLDDGQLSAVIDFGTCGVGDPACDLAVAWTLLTAEGRQAFRDRLSVDRGVLGARAWLGTLEGARHLSIHVRRSCGRGGARGRQAHPRRDLLRVLGRLT